MNNSSLSFGTTTPVCKLRLQGLRSIDASVVQVFLKILREQTACRWELSSEEAVDLLLVSPQHVDAGELLTWRGAVAWVIPHEERHPQVSPDGHAYLTQPLQLENFYEVLRAAERHIARAAATAPSHPIQTPAEQVTPVQPPPVERTMSCRLRRWPQAGILAAHRYYPRLASFLSSRYLTIQQLATLSNVNWQVCIEFVGEMRRLGLLDVRQSVSTEDSPRVPPHMAKAEAATPGQVSAISGLVGRLRDRLGLRPNPPNLTPKSLI